MDFIINNPYKQWDWYYISLNPTINIDFIIQNRPNIGNVDYGRALSCNSNLTIDFIKKNPNHLWDWSYISQNPNITLEDIELNPDLNDFWNWRGVSSNPNLFHVTYSVYKKYKKHKHLKLIKNFEKCIQDILNLSNDILYDIIKNL